MLQDARLCPFFQPIFQQTQLFFIFTYHTHHYSFRVSLFVSYSIWSNVCSLIWLLYFDVEQCILSNIPNLKVGVFYISPSAKFVIAYSSKSFDNTLAPHWNLVPFLLQCITPLCIYLWENNALPHSPNEDWHYLNFAVIKCANFAFLNGTKWKKQTANKNWYVILQVEVKERITSRMYIVSISNNLPPHKTILLKHLPPQSLVVWSLLVIKLGDKERLPNILRSFAGQYSVEIKCSDLEMSLTKVHENDYTDDRRSELFSFAIAIVQNLVAVYLFSYFWGCDV